MTENAQQKHTPIVFQGKTSEYFGIWIVNLLLSIVTLGIYSAWAKVRRKKYFYNNTLIENVGFDYHAKPISILKGRVIALVFFAGYGMSANMHPFLPAVFLLIFFMALPWLVVRGSIFNARNSSHRGLRFDFAGKIGQAVKVFIGLPLLLVPTLGLIMPYNAHQKNQFLMDGHKFGLSQFNMHAKVKSFYRIYLIGGIVPVLAVIGILAAIAIPAYKGYLDKANAQTGKQSGLYLPEERVKLSLVGFAPIIQGQTLLAKNEEAIEIESSAPIEQSEKTDETTSVMMVAGTVLGVALLYALLFASIAYMQARIGNLVLNNTTLDKLSFKSTLRARDFIWLYFSNIIAIMLTFGLATPWAQIRMAKYRASKLQIVGDVDFDQFVGDKKAEVKATGEEIAEMFDVDLSFG